MKNVAVLGSGVVGQILADGFLKHGYAVMRGTRDPAKLADWKAGAGAQASTGTFEEAAKFGAIVVLAVKGSVAEQALKQAGHANLEGKTVIDATNPIADEKPENGVLRFTTGANESLMEQLQKAAPEVRFVKAFNSVGNAHMVNPDFGGDKPTMFICGNDDGAKDQVRGVLTQFGWDTADMGTATSARAIEPLCMLWCIPAIREGKMGHAFKLLRK